MAERLSRWRAVEPEKKAPYISGCRDTHILAEKDGGRYFVPREWL